MNNNKLLRWSHLSLRTSQKTIIEDETGYVAKQTLTALLGPSGAGKTSVLNSLAGRVPDSVTISGQILFKDRPRDKSWAKSVAYIEQSFWAYTHQTVYETILFSALFRSTSSDIEGKINYLINLLGLGANRDTMLCKLSGGEYKRVSIGVELVADPELIFLDEPTSGLDSFNALNLVKFLKELTQHGKTILLTIHQPSYKISKNFTKIKLLSQGKTIVDANIDECIQFFDRAGYALPENTNPLDYFMDIIALNTENKESLEVSHKRINSLAQRHKTDDIDSSDDRFEEIAPKAAIDQQTHDTDKKKDETHSANMNNRPRIQTRAAKLLAKFFVFPFLFRRNMIELYRDEKYLKIQVFQKITFTLLLGLCYLQLGYSMQDIQSRTGIIFFLLINNLFGTAGPIFNVFPTERNIIQRERRSGMYDGFSAYLAKFLSNMTYNVCLSLLYITAVYWMVGLNPNAGRFFIFLIIQMSAVVFSIALGLTVGTLSPSQNFAQVFGTTILIIYIIFGGGFSNPNTIPGWLRWFIWVSPVNYAFRASMQNQYRGLQFENTTGNQVLEQSGIASPSVWANIFGLWGLTLAWILLGSFGLHYVTRLKLTL